MGRRAMSFLLLFVPLFFPRFLQAACPAAPLPFPLGVVPKISYEIIGRLPHDPEAFTQGLVFVNGMLYESTGRYGASSLRMIDPLSGTILRRRTLPAPLFGEGLAYFDGKLIQLTWKEGTAYVYRATDFSLRHTFSFKGEGWGLTADDLACYMSDGSSEITIRSPVDFTEKRRIKVRVGEKTIAGINELELAGHALYANIWQEDVIVRIDPASGAVSGYLDTGGLSWPSRPCGRGEKVANGIAYDCGRDLFYLTGKNWPYIFIVHLSE